MGKQDSGISEREEKQRIMATKYTIMYTHIQRLLRNMSAALLALILYFQLFFHTFNPDHGPLIIWWGSYFAFTLLNYALRAFWAKGYEHKWVISVRILANIAFITWLLAISPTNRHLIAYTYFIPLFSAFLYFPSNKIYSTIMYILICVGVDLGGFVFPQENPLLWWQGLIIWGVLGLLARFLKTSFSKMFDAPSDLSSFSTELNKSLDIHNVELTTIAYLKDISGADKIFVGAKDPQRKMQVFYRADGVEINPDVDMEEFIGNCHVIASGQPYERRDIKGTEAEEYFKKIFIDPPRGILIAPIKNGQSNTTIGLVIIGYDKPRKVDVLIKKAIFETVNLAGNQIKNSLEHINLQLEMSCKDEISGRLLEALTEDEVTSILVSEIREIVPQTSGSIFHKYYPDENELIAEAGINAGKLEPWKASHDDVNHMQSARMAYGEGLAGAALEKREPLYANDVRSSHLFKKSAQLNDFRSLISAPLVDPEDDRPIGTLSVHCAEPNAFTAEDFVKVYKFADHGSKCISRIKKNEQWRLEGGMLKKIFGSVLQMKFSGSENDLCQELVESFREILPFDLARIRLLDRSGEYLQTVAAASPTLNGPPKDYHDNVPLQKLETFFTQENQVERSYFINGENPIWKSFADHYLEVPPQTIYEHNNWGRYDALFTPIITEDDEMIGYFSVDMPTAWEGPQKDIIEAIGACASVIAWSIELHREKILSAQKQKYVKIFIERITEMISKDFNTLGEVIVNIGADLLNSEACSLYLVKDKKYIELTHSTYLRGTRYIGRRKPIRVQPKSGLTSWVAASKKPIRMGKEEFQEFEVWSGEHEQLEYLKSGGSESVMILPLLDKKGDIRGVLSFENKYKNNSTEEEITLFSKEDQDLADTLAEEIGVSLSTNLMNQVDQAKIFDIEVLGDNVHELKNLFQSGVRTPAENALFWLEGGNISKAQEQLIHLDKYSQTILDELYSMHHSIEKKYYEMGDLNVALNTLIALILARNPRTRTKDLNIKVQCPEDIELPPLIQYAFMRVASNALLNAVEHSNILNDPNVQIDVIVNHNRKVTSLIVRDTGVGTDDLKEGWGIQRMRSLVLEIKKLGIDAKLEIKSSKGNGTSVILTTRTEPDA